MKTKITLFVAVLAVALFEMGCASNSPLENSTSLIRAEDVVGTYNFTDDQKQFQYNFLQNGTVMRWFDGKPTKPAAWKIEGVEIRTDFDNESTHYLSRDGETGNLRIIAWNEAGKKKRHTSNNGWTAVKVK